MRILAIPLAILVEMANRWRMISTSEIYHQELYANDTSKLTIWYTNFSSLNECRRERNDNNILQCDRPTSRRMWCGRQFLMSTFISTSWYYNRLIEEGTPRNGPHHLEVLKMELHYWINRAPTSQLNAIVLQLAIPTLLTPISRNDSVIYLMHSSRLTALWHCMSPPAPLAILGWNLLFQDKTMVLSS